MGVKRGLFFLFIGEEHKLQVWERNINEQII
jgi:hypothetical protein